MRSFRLPVGFSLSILTKTRALPLGTTERSSTSGVEPILFKDRPMDGRWLRRHGNLLNDGKRLGRQFRPYRSRFHAPIASEQAARNGMGSTIYK